MNGQEFIVAISLIHRLRRATPAAGVADNASLAATLSVIESDVAGGAYHGQPDVGTEEELAREVVAVTAAAKSLKRGFAYEPRASRGTPLAPWSQMIFLGTGFGDRLWGSRGDSGRLEKEVAKPGDR